MTAEHAGASVDDIGLVHGGLSRRLAEWLGFGNPSGSRRLLRVVQSLADIATCYEHVERMWPIPFDTKAFAVLVLAALLPMILLLGTEIPLTEIFLKLGELLV